MKSANFYLLLNFLRIIKEALCEPVYKFNVELYEAEEMQEACRLCLEKQISFRIKDGYSLTVYSLNH